MRSVIVIDDHPVFRAGLSGFVDRSPDMRVVAEAATAARALEIARDLAHVDAVIVDLSLPDGHGLTLIPRIASLLPEARILVVSMHDELVYADRCLQAGAHGYVSKVDPPEAILDALRRIWSGKLAVGARVAELAVERLAGSRAERPRRLSNREEEVFDLVGQGLTTREIADRLEIGVKTVETHIARLRDKLGANNKTELSRMAYARRLEHGSGDL
ncbi:MAG: response regulator transcription factor [Alphaproteobacteria bacterium]|nr:response regulator transcription factor [Alphaproteobacteria bacterium]MCB9699885.1 response regulator transcription factor [Alphaproteobacteria bacterium]